LIIQRMILYRWTARQPELHHLINHHKSKQSGIRMTMLLIIAAIVTPNFICSISFTTSSHHFLFALHSPQPGNAHNSTVACTAVFRFFEI
jgi:hypothetical protein